MDIVKPPGLKKIYYINILYEEEVSMKRVTYRVLTAISVLSLICTNIAFADRERGAAISGIVFGFEVLTDQEQNFENNSIKGWNTLSDDVSIEIVSDGEIGKAMAVSSGTGGYGVTAEIGNRLYESASPLGMLFWDFEDETSNEVSVENSLEYGKWTGQNLKSDNPYRDYMRPKYTKMEDVYYVNPLKETPPKNENPPLVEGSTGCIALWCPQKQGSTPQPQVMSIRTKLSRNVLGDNRTFNISFYSMVNVSENAVYACFRNPNYPDNLQNLGNVTTSEIPFIADDQSASVGTIKVGWARYETTITLPDDAFDENGDTVLWLITRPRSVKEQSTGRYWQLTAGQYLYFDNISISPQKETEVSEYVFNCRAMGKKDQKITVLANVDNKRVLFEKNLVIEGDGQWQNINAGFEISEDDVFIVGANRGSDKVKDNDKVKIYIKSDGTSEELYLDDISLIKKSDGDLSKLTSRNVSLYANSFFTIPDTQNVELVCVINKNGEKTQVANASARVSFGNKMLFTGFNMPNVNKDTVLEFYINGENGTRFTERVYKNAFFAGGANIVYDKNTKLKALLNTFGQGEYLVEFEAVDVKGKISASIGDAKSEFPAENDGAYALTFEITENIITALGENDILQVNNANVENVTIKKVLDY